MNKSNISDTFDNIILNSKAYNYLKLHYNIGRKFNIGSINRFTPVKSDDKKTRVTLILPRFRKSDVFGGISTSIKFGLDLAEYLGADFRILVQSNETYGRDTYELDGFSHNSENKGLFFMGESRKIKVRKNEIFIAVFWTSAYILPSILKWEKKVYGRINPFVYLIQDFEPGFFRWSTEYCLAESTYRNCPENIIAVYNSKELYCYFKNNGYKFHDNLYFTPYLNDRLRKYLFDKPQVKRKKQIIFYGRPGTARNAFEIVSYSLKLFSEKYKNASEWTIKGLGENFGSLKLKNNIVRSCGKLSLDEYAACMKESYAGISLMISPHPSYPPLEMAAFGVQTITNSFVCKDLSSFSKNIHSLDICTAENIEKELEKICDGYYKGLQSSIMDKDNDYIKGEDFDKCIIALSRILKETIC
ncbi:MAG: hypothetical protein VZR00_03455 [Lachnospiraceae bacterium]|nr:hypothetical protein [Lachnospiraceae bacterium]